MDEGGCDMRESNVEDACSNAENFTATSEENVGRSKKKKRPNDGAMKEELHQFSTVAQSANKVLNQLVNKQKAAPVDDKDWDFCRHLYNKMKEIPDGYVKDDLQLEMQQLIAKAKKQYFNPSYPSYNMYPGSYQGNYETNVDNMRAASQLWPQPGQQQSSTGNPGSAGSCSELLQSSSPNMYCQL